MITIQKIEPNEVELLLKVAKASFIASHGMSAKPEEIQAYISEKYTIKQFEEELKNCLNHYFFIRYNDEIAGFSKLVFNHSFSEKEISQISKLERLYLLEKYYDLKLGFQLFAFNVELAKKNHQKGIWLYVWTENYRALKFYEKAGFKIIGKHDFKISENHSNPNYQLFLSFKEGD